jgi:tetratricopeptide (TPR) repeat protein
MHITRDLLRAVASGELPPRLLARVGLEHLTAICPCCEREVAAWREEDRESDRPLDPELMVPLLAAATPQIAKAEERAERDFFELLALPVGARPARVARSRSRFRGPALVRRLLGASRESLSGDFETSYHLAALALSIADRSAHTFDLHVLAAAAMGNACRAQCDLRKADRHFEYVRFLLHSQDVTDLAVLAEVDDLEGSLRKDQRRFEQAESLLERAYALYRLAGREERSIKVMVILADVHFYRGDPHRAISTLVIALRKIRPDSEVHDYLCARHNLAWYLMSCDRCEEALELFDEDAELFARNGRSVDKIRRRWLGGMISAGLGRPQAAEEAFVEARDALVERGMGFAAAMVSMDLAALYLRAGRMKEVRSLAESMIPIFQAQDIHREALAALILFQEAARREAVTLAFVERLAVYLREAEVDFELKFREGETGRIR